MEIGFKISLPSKHNLFLAFQIAQQMAAIPSVWNFLPNGSHFSHHSQHGLRDLGTSVAPKQTATVAQTTLAVLHWNTK
jgi:hypothetical protein